MLGDGDIFEASAKERLYNLEPLQKRGTAFTKFAADGDITHAVLRAHPSDEPGVGRTTDRHAKCCLQVSIHVIRD